MDIGHKHDYADAGEVARALFRLRDSQPFRFSGEWLVSHLPDGQGVAYRSERDLMRRWNKVRGDSDALTVLRVRCGTS